MKVSHFKYNVKLTPIGANSSPATEEMELSNDTQISLSLDKSGC